MKKILVFYCLLGCLIFSGCSTLNLIRPTGLATLKVVINKHPSVLLKDKIFFRSGGDFVKVLFCYSAGSGGTSDFNYTFMPNGVDVIIANPKKFSIRYISHSGEVVGGFRQVILEIINDPTEPGVQVCWFLPGSDTPLWYEESTEEEYKSVFRGRSRLGCIFSGKYSAEPEKKEPLATKKKESTPAAPAPASVPAPVQPENLDWKGLQKPSNKVEEESELEDCSGQTFYKVMPGESINNTAANMSRWLGVPGLLTCKDFKRVFAKYIRKYRNGPGLKADKELPYFLLQGDSLWPVWKARLANERRCP